MSKDPRDDATAFVVVDLGFGDSGKGTVVDHLVRHRKAEAVIRFNGGPQAAHHVVLPDGRWHPFSQFGSGTFVPGVRTHLTADVLFDPLALMNEAKALALHGVHDALDCFGVNEACKVITPFHAALNQVRELQRRHDRRHGSCGMGVGETMAQHGKNHELTVYAKDLRPENRPDLVDKLEALQEYCRETALPLTDGSGDGGDGRAWAALTTAEALSWCVDRFDIAAGWLRDAVWTQDREDEFLDPGRGRVSVWEGAQGVLLDETFGFHPYTTWSTTTPRNAWSALRGANYQIAHQAHAIGVVRAYMTRHGPGPFPTEELSLEFEERFGLPDHNKFGPWQGGLRVGWPDPLLWRYAIEACRVPWRVAPLDSLAVTCLDRFDGMDRVKVCRGYDFQSLGYTTKRRMERVPLDRHPSLAGQELLGLILSQHVRPAYDEVEPRDLPFVLNNTLEVPVGLLSRGPTFEHKEELTLPPS